MKISYLINVNICGDIEIRFRDKNDLISFVNSNSSMMILNTKI